MSSPRLMRKRHPEIGSACSPGVGCARVLSAPHLRRWAVGFTHRPAARRGTTATVVVKVGTFNLNNLFSRYNFQGEIQAIAAGECTKRSGKLTRWSATWAPQRVASGRLGEVDRGRGTRPISCRLQPARRVGIRPLAGMRPRR
jgi:hypothetical protein